MALAVSTLIVASTFTYCGITSWVCIVIAEHGDWIRDSRKGAGGSSGNSTSWMQLSLLHMDGRDSLTHVIMTVLCLMKTFVQSLKEVRIDYWLLTLSLTRSSSIGFPLQIPAGRVRISCASARSLLTGPKLHPCLGRCILSDTPAHICHYHETGYKGP
jgi:hypothetical protein